MLGPQQLFGTRFRFDPLFRPSWSDLAEVTHSYRAITTQDRLCPTGKHDKTRGGCPCVQVGGDPGLPTGFQAGPTGVLSSPGSLSHSKSPRRFCFAL